MAENILVALSNLPSLYPIYLSLNHKDYLTTFSLLFVSTFSFLSHLVENHKHGMPGIGVPRAISHFLNRLDVLGCLFVSSRLAYLYYNKFGFAIGQHKTLLLIHSLPFIPLRISEYDKYNLNLKPMYIVTHSLWHISIFLSLGSFLSKLIY